MRKPLKFRSFLKFTKQFWPGETFHNPVQFILKSPTLQPM